LIFASFYAADDIIKNLLRPPARIAYFLTVPFGASEIVQRADAETHPS
jgi:hypothetical protein